jgi:hypothetical protein
MLICVYTFTSNKTVHVVLWEGYSALHDANMNSIGKVKEESNYQCRKSKQSLDSSVRIIRKRKI